MSIADKLRTIANNLIRILNQGKELGKEQRDYEWWHHYQNTNVGTHIEKPNHLWRYAFAGACWTDVTYNPIYDINIGGNSTDMYANSYVTDTKVAISDVDGSSTKTFRNSELVTIRKYIVSEKTIMVDQFTGCGCLENLTIEGTIGKDANFQWCECLTLESLVSIVNALKNFTTDDPDNEFTCTIQFSDDCWDILKTSRPDPTAPTWFEIITYKGWNT